jgi:hypothetical protein
VSRQRSQLKEYVGKKFGYLRVLGFAGVNRNGASLVTAACENPNAAPFCKRVWTGPFHCLKRNVTTSCGCRRVETGSRLKTTRGDREQALFACIGRIRRGALRRGLVWEISNALAEELILSQCFYKYLGDCGVSKSPDRFPIRGLLVARGGIDRLDSTRGYTVDNVIPCCSRHNQIKANLTAEYFSSLAEGINRARRLAVEGRLSETRVLDPNHGVAPFGAVSVPVE